MPKAKSKGGRRPKSRNRGYFYRNGRGWYASDQAGRSMVPLEYEDGARIREKDADPHLVKEAYARWMLTKNDEPATNGQIELAPVSVVEVCDAYLADAKVNGAPKTYSDRVETLFDFCFGVPPKFRHFENPTDHQLDEMESARIHPGYGGLLASELTPLHIDRWLNAHENWNGGRRTRIQAVKRALNYGVERKMIQENPIKGYRVTKTKGRVTYLTPEQEEAIYSESNTAFATAVRVCIRTGARFGCEFTKLTARHVKDDGSRMEWVFLPEESKTGKLRTIRVTDARILGLVREQVNRHRSGPLFRNSQHAPWTQESLSKRFRAVKRRVEAKQGIIFDDDTCMYSCRHTYAKRTLQGYWSGKPTNIETLARLMGNTPQVCRDHYLQWCESYNEPLWEAC